MSKIKLIVMVSIFLLIVGCTDTTVSLWDDVDGGIGSRIGYVMDNTEVGLSFLYFSDEENDNSEIFGAYGLYKFPDMVEIPNPVNAEFLPETIKGTPYLGGKVDSDGGDSLLIAGIEIENTLFMEYQDNYILAGLKHKF